ncbi:MAG: hypothetical protein J7M06_05110 [Proteobacteria bacterium]|nr:hypothetical protein [Pseudomonadota bacterium]
MFKMIKLADWNIQPSKVSSGKENFPKKLTEPFIIYNATMGLSPIWGVYP